MTYKDFLKQAKLIGDGGLCEVSIDGRVDTQVMLTKQNSCGGFIKNKWFILQDVFDGIEAKDKKGYRYSYVVLGDSISSHLDFIRPLKKNKRGTSPRGKSRRFIATKPSEQTRLDAIEKCLVEIKESIERLEAR